MSSDSGAETPRLGAGEPAAGIGSGDTYLLSLRIPRSLFQALEAASRAENRTISDAVEYAIVEYPASRDLA